MTKAVPHHVLGKGGETVQVVRILPKSLRIYRRRQKAIKKRKRDLKSR